MSDEHEPGLLERVPEDPSIHPDKLRELRPRELGYRFLSGALTSVCAGLLALWLGPRVGGLLLAFPAILAASLTLIEEQEDSVEAREDARGAVLGSCAMAAFAAIAALALHGLAGALALLLAAVGWVAVCLAGYWLLWR